MACVEGGHREATFGPCTFTPAKTRQFGSGAHSRQQTHGTRPTLHTRGEMRSRSGSVEVLLELMANGADSDNVATHLKCGNEPGAPKGNDEFTLLFVQGASGLAA